MPLILGIIAGVVLLGVIVFFVVRGLSGSDDSATPDPSPSQATTEPTQATSEPTSEQSQAVTPQGPAETVEAYFAALNAGDAQAALDLSSDIAEQRILLTDQVLSQATQDHQFTDVSVDVDELGGTADVSYRFDGQIRNASLYLIDRNGRWLVQNPTIKVILPIGAPTVGIKVNGQEVSAEHAQVFPGAYTIEYGSELIGNADPVLLIDGSNQYVTVDPPGLTEAGLTAVNEAVDAHMTACARNHDSLEIAECGMKFTTQTSEGVAVKEALDCAIEVEPQPINNDMIRLEIDLKSAKVNFGSDGPKYECKAESVEGEPLEGYVRVLGAQVDLSNPENMVVTFSS